MVSKPSTKSLGGPKASKPPVVSKHKSKATRGKSTKIGRMVSRYLSPRQSGDTIRGWNTSGKPAKLFSNARSRPKRKQGQNWCSMKSILTASKDSNEVLIDHGSNFGKGSMANLTWGKISDQPVFAITKQRRHGGFRQLGIRRGNTSTFEKLMFMPFPNDVDISLLLAIPLEIRQNIYKFLLVHKRPIVLDSNWHKIRRSASLSYEILIVNKQIMQEGTQFIYEKNTFQALLEQPSSSVLGPVIESKFHQHLRNVAIECSKKQWTEADLDLMGHSINVLIEANAVLDSLTTIISPQRIRKSAINAEFDGDDDVITFANFFVAPASKLMRRITKLRCKTWNIVVKLYFTKRILVSIDMAGTTGNQCGGGWFTGDLVMKQSGYEKTAIVKKELRGLKTKIEQIFEDNERSMIAAMEGEIDISNYENGSTKASKEAELEAALKKVPIQLRRKWDDGEGKLKTYEMLFKPVAERVLQGLSEGVHVSF